MIPRVLSSRTFGLTLAMLLLAACDGARSEPAVTSTPVVPRTTLTSITPPRVPTQGFELVTCIPDAVGTWYWPGEGLYLRFYEDGMLHHAHGCDDDPYAVSEYWFEGPRMVIRTVSISGVPPCGDVIGIYEVRLFANYGIEIVPVEDSCSPRRRDMAAMYEAVR